MICRACRIEAFTFRGLCRECAPDLHWADRVLYEFVAEAEAGFMRATGKRSLSYYDEFEEYMDREAEGRPDVIQALQLLSPRETYQ